MGMYFEIRFEIPHSDKRYVVQFFTALAGLSAWSEVVEFAQSEWKKLFAENKYWVLKEIVDITLR